MSSFNAFTQKKYTGGGSIPVWLGVVSPRPVGGTLANAFLQPGILIPAGTPVCFDEANKKVTPLVAFKVAAYSAAGAEETYDTITILPAYYGGVEILPAADDLIQKLGDTFASTAKAGVVHSITALTGDDAGKFAVEVAKTANLGSLSEGDFVVLSAAVSAGNSKSMANQPNAYLYNDICIDALNVGEEYESKAASAAVVDFHGEGLLYKRIPYGDLTAALKAAIPNVILVGF